MTQHFSPFGFNAFCLFETKVTQVFAKANSRVCSKNRFRDFRTGITGCNAHKCQSAFLTPRPIERQREKKNLRDKHAPERMLYGSPQVWRSCHRFL